MGLSSSRPNFCPYCAVEIKVPDDNDNDHSTQSSQSNDELIFTCSRCHGAIKFKSSKQIEFEEHPQPIQYLHIAPFANDSLFEALKTFNSEEKYDDIKCEDQEMDSEMIMALKMSMEQDLDIILINNYLKPFFNNNCSIFVKNGVRLITSQIEFKVFGCYPPFGFVTNSTQFILNDVNDELIQLKYGAINRIHILPINASLSTYCKHNKQSIDNIRDDLFKSHIQRYLEGNDDELFIKSTSIFEGNQYKKRHLMEGETFLYKNIEFIVMKCEPSNGYIDLKLTQIFCKGNALRDISSINIRPKYDCLPMNHRHFSSSEVLNYYLKKYFYGKCSYIDNDIISINNVEFMINECIPQNGIMICCTHICDAKPIENREILQIQQRKDQEYAQQIQNEYNNIYNNNNINNNDPFIQFIRLLQQYNAMRMDMEFEEKDNNQNRGIDDRLINTLPTYKYTQKNDNKSCRICLEEYQNNNELRALPCFHSFHKDCVDQWFQINDKCPVCKTSVIDNR